MIAEIIDGLIGVGAGFASGRFSRRKKSAPAATTQAVPICGCTHSVALHDKATRMCFATVPNKVYKSGVGYIEETVQCPCRQYVGPIPVDEYTSMPVAWDYPATRPAPNLPSTVQMDTRPKPAKRKARKGDPDWGPP